MPSTRPDLPHSRAEWHRRVWLLAGPIILSNLSVPLVGAVDTAVVGHLPDATALAAVALGAVIFNFALWGFGFLRMGTTGLVAQAAGKAAGKAAGSGDPHELQALLQRALLLAALLAAALLLLQRPLAALAFRVVDGGAELEALARDDYFAVRIWSAPATLANYALLGALIGLQRSGAALLVQLALNLSNVALDLLFVIGFDWGVAGVASASLLAEYLALGIGLWLLGRHPGWRILPRAELFDRQRLAALLTLNGNLFVRTVCLLSGFFYFTAVGTRLGELTLAANAVLMNLVNFLAFGLDGFAHAAEALAGGAYGARRAAAFRAAVCATSLWALLAAALCSLLYAFAGTAIVGLLTDIPEVLAACAEYLPWLAGAPLVFFWSYQLDGIFVGATRSREMRNGALLSLGVFLLACQLLVPAFGNHGLWLALYLFMACRALSLGYYYPRLLAALRAPPADGATDSPTLRGTP